MTKVWKFDDTGEAYDATMCDEAIKTGDTLVAHGDGVVGVAHTWPVAVTKKHGEFHKFKNPEATPVNVLTGEVLLDKHDYWSKLKVEHILAAVEVAKEMGLELDDGLGAKAAFHTAFEEGKTK
jgi:hypothetical protein